MSDVTVYLASDLHPSEHVVLQPDYESLKFYLAALREELDAVKANGQHWYKTSGDAIDAMTSVADQRDATQQRLTAAEQRNSELVDLLRECSESISRVHHFALKRRLEAALNPAESGASE